MPSEPYMCSECNCVLVKDNTYPSWWSGDKMTKKSARLCKPCNTDKTRERHGWTKREIQEAGKPFTFIACGCSGVLPEYGFSNQFVGWKSSAKRPGWHCRVGEILRGINRAAVIGNYIPIPLDTPHDRIRKMMLESKCERCQLPLHWPEIWKGKQAPHLHHNHINGSIYGFTHQRCNLWALEFENEKLRNENKSLKQLLTELGHEI